MIILLILFEVQTLVAIFLIATSTLASFAIGLFVTMQCSQEITQGISYLQDILGQKQWGEYLPFQISHEDVCDLLISFLFGIIVNQTGDWYQCDDRIG
jgi:hypothetical protein